MNDQSGPSGMLPEAVEAAPKACGRVADYHARMAGSSLNDDPFLCGKTVGFVMNFLKHDKGLIDDRDFFEFIAHVLGDDAVFALARTACRMISLPSELRETLETSRGFAHGILVRLWNEPDAQPLLKDALLAALAEKRALFDQTAATAKDDLFARRFAEMVRLFSLNDTEADLVLLAYVRYANI